MKQLLQSEQLLACLAGLGLLSFLPLSLHWAWYIPLFFAPDLGMLGYLAGPRAGAISYNLFHHQGIALALALAGLSLALPWLMATGIILFAHAAFDRVFGYGLKHFVGFKHTHLGILPEKQKQRP